MRGEGGGKRLEYSTIQNIFINAFREIQEICHANIISIMPLNDNKNRSQLHEDLHLKMCPSYALMVVHADDHQNKKVQVLCVSD